MKSWGRRLSLPMFAQVTGSRHTMCGFFRCCCQSLTSDNVHTRLQLVCTSSFRKTVTCIGVSSVQFFRFVDHFISRYAIVSGNIQAEDVTTQPAMRPILFKLAHRLITSSPTPSYVNADRFHLHLSLLRELGLYEEAEQLLESDIGRSICATSLSCDEVRRHIWHRQGRTQQEGDRAERLIVDKR